MNSYRKHGGESGFTLIELIVVCTLIGIMLSLGLPSFRNAVYTDPLKSSTRKVIGFVGGIRELAVRKQEPYWLYISQIDNRLWYEKDDDIVEGGISEEKSDESEEFEKQELQLPETVRISEIDTNDSEDSTPPTRVWISKKGHLTRTAIHLEDDDGKTLVVRLYPFIESATVSDSDESL